MLTALGHLHGNTFDFTLANSDKQYLNDGGIWEAKRIAKFQEITKS